MKRNRTIHRIRSPRIREPLRIAVAADLHSAPFDDVLEDFRACDAVLIPWDLVDRHRRNNDRKRIRESGTVLLDNDSREFRGIRIGGLSSTASRIPDIAFLDRFEREDGFRLLMCHHPEMYRDYVRGRDIDFTVCGHAHGGQIQIAGRGLYAPGQGLFPKLTHGLHDGGKMMISRGMTNGAKPRIPRICNPCELIILELSPDT